MDQLDRKAEFEKAIRRMFKSRDGELVAEMLEEMYVTTSALDVEKVELTYYRLGQKELIQGILNSVKKDPEEITVKTGE